MVRLLVSKHRITWQAGCNMCNWGPGMAGFRLLYCCIIQPIAYHCPRMSPNCFHTFPHLLHANQHQPHNNNNKGAAAALHLSQACIATVSACKHSCCKPHLLKFDQMPCTTVSSLHLKLQPTPHSPSPQASVRPCKLWACLTAKAMSCHKQIQDRQANPVTLPNPLPCHPSPPSPHPLKHVR